MLLKWNDSFYPSYTPKEMLQMGIFGGFYIRKNNFIAELPKDWIKDVKLSTLGKPDPSLNYYKVNASQDLNTWDQNGWLMKEDPLGWFQWYCRYYMGRRNDLIDNDQIKRWKSFVSRHMSQVALNCKLDDSNCRPTQRQSLLHWAWNSSELNIHITEAKNLNHIVIQCKKETGIELCF